MLLEGSNSGILDPGLALIGPNTATCMKSREWEPDPSQFMCNK